ncbi:plasma membrane heat shock protein [Umbelopsis sp. WA50703]|jgi:putative intracellular protease/amidase
MPSLPRKALISITSYNEVFYEDGARTGLFYTEALHPYLALTEVGFDVELASETGKCGVDEHSKDKMFLSDEDEKILNDPSHAFNVKLKNVHKASDLKASDFGLFFAAGGHGTLWDYPTAKSLIAIAEDIYKRGGVVAAVCHGPAILPSIKDANGKSIIAGKTVTGFTTQGEIELNVMNRMNEAGVSTISDSAVAAGGKYFEPPKPFDDYSMVDGRVVTGVNPASAHSTAEKAIKVFDSLQN